MITLDTISSLADFQHYVRYFIQAKTLPHEINWNSEEKTLFDRYLSLNDVKGREPLLISLEVSKMIKGLAMLRGPHKWALIYRLLFRLKFENKDLLHLKSDKDVREADLGLQSIGRDIHKMHAFVRFKRAPSNEESYIAWHGPEHFILRAAIPFFVKRFGDRPWTIHTPDESAHWNLKELHYSAGIALEEFKVTDDWDQVWKDYYRAIYNPARLNIKMMKQEMSPKYWQSMPESEVIYELIKETPDMLKRAFDSKWTEAVVRPELTLRELNEELAHCRACPLHEKATQVVRGEGPLNAEVVILGEQPGDIEDQLGRPFMGPSGKLLNNLLAEIGLVRESLYLTNTVKHFNFEMNLDGRRIHKSPSGRVMHACRPWLEAELKKVRPKIILALGVAAATAVLGRRPVLAKERGRILNSKYGNIILSWHPSSILRSTPESADLKMAQLRSDLELVLNKAL